MENSFKEFSIQPKNTSFDFDNDDADSLHRQKVTRFKQDTKHRDTLVKWMMWIVSIWLGLVLVIVFLNKPLHIENEVIITLLATTTINILGLANIILKGMFGKSSTRFLRKGKDPKQY